MFVAHQSGLPRALDDFPKELRGRFMLDQPVAIVREGTVIERLLDHVHVEEPAKEKVLAELLAELRFAADRVERDQEHPFEQALRGHGRPSCLAVHPIERTREPFQRIVRQDLDRTQRMFVRDQLL